MRLLALLLIATSSLVAAPALAQSTAPDQQYEADRRRAELNEWGARADAQAAAAQRAQAQQRYVLRSTEPVPVMPRTSTQAYDRQSAMVTDRLQLDAAEARDADAELRALDARLKEIDAFLARPPQP